MRYSCFCVFCKYVPCSIQPEDCLDLLSTRKQGSSPVDVGLPSFFRPFASSTLLSFLSSSSTYSYPANNRNFLFRFLPRLRLPLRRQQRLPPVKISRFLLHYVFFILTKLSSCLSLTRHSSLGCQSFITIL